MPALCEKPCDRINPNNSKFLSVLPTFAAKNMAKIHLIFELTAFTMSTEIYQVPARLW